MSFPSRQANNRLGVSTAQSGTARKISTAINRAITRMKSGDKVGLVALSDKITEALEEDTIGTLVKLAPYMPKALLDSGGQTTVGVNVIIQRDSVTIKDDNTCITVDNDTPLDE